MGKCGFDAIGSDGFVFNGHELGTIMLFMQAQHPSHCHDVKTQADSVQEVQIWMWASCGWFRTGRRGSLDESPGRGRKVAARGKDAPPPRRTR
jgi:hypothetical protein